MRFTRLAAIFIGVLFAAFMVMDWNFILAKGSIHPHTLWLKYGVTLICLALAWNARGHTICRLDALLLRVAFLFIALADFFLVLLCEIVDNPSARPVLSIAGAASFVVVQLFLIIRHLAAVRAADPPELHVLRKLSPPVAVPLLYTPVIIAAIECREKLITLGWLAVVALAYVFLLLASVWTGWVTTIRSTYPHTNAMMIAIGMTCFLFCDICVICQVFMSGRPAAVANGLVWLFYTPALLLLALSGYRNHSFPDRTME
jgi:hypothetical protein